jgi:hypothetical protein|tara:strand:- start:1221 stop:1379 length:159 start_codon:yes stop_codon:yes gene_type:complete
MVEEVNNSVGDENLETSTNANTGDVTRSRSMRRRWSIRNIKWNLGLKIEEEL